MKWIWSRPRQIGRRRAIAQLTEPMDPGNFEELKKAYKLGLETGAWITVSDFLNKQSTYEDHHITSWQRNELNAMYSWWRFGLLADLVGDGIDAD